MFDNMILKSILVTGFWRQNDWHQHGVFLHTMKVTYNVIKGGDYRMIAAGLLHDIGKPFVAFQKPKDILNNEHSFTDHEEASYQIIKNWPFISDYTKNMVRYHYLIRDMALGYIKNNGRFEPKARIFNSLSKEMKADLKVFLKYDDLGKGTTPKAINGIPLDKKFSSTT
jgi:CRISPR/Cas system-associated endonuclease Cas3-HD